MKIITSKDNPLFKSFKKLESSTKDRREAGKTLLDGEHLISAYVDSVGSPELIIVNQTSAHSAATQGLLARIKPDDTIVLPDSLFREISSLKTQTGIIAQIAIPQHKLDEPTDFCVLLEDIQDPGNVGAILRSAAAAGATHIYLSQKCADVWSPKTLRAGMGAHFNLQLHENADLVAMAKAFNGITVATNLSSEQSFFTLDLTGPTAFLIGNEGAGLSSALLACAKACVTIPMLGKMESLNAGAAAAICFFERVRQLGK